MKDRGGGTKEEAGFLAPCREVKAQRSGPARCTPQGARYSSTWQGAWEYKVKLQW